MARLREEETGSGDLEARGRRLAGDVLTSPVHLRTIDVLGKLLTMAVDMTGEDTPTHLRMLVLMLEKGRPLLVEGLAKVPDSQVIEFMRSIRDDIQSIIDTGEEGNRVAANLGAPLPFPDLDQP